MMRPYVAHQIAIYALNGLERNESLIREAYATLVTVADTGFGTEARRLAERFPQLCDKADLDWVDTFTLESAAVHPLDVEPIYSNA